MISRLHNFDCSMAQPSTVMYIEYCDGDLYDLPYPLITNGAIMTYEEALSAMEQYNKNALSGYHAKIITPSIATSPVEIDALRYFRLIHESPSQGVTGDYDIKYVKVFEYVPGAIISGEGTIEANIITNTGRSFVYRQKSKDGKFIVPYSSEGCPYETHATGNYRIIETGREFAVSEDAVQQGLKIN
jgi:asparagine N-glycosylation enzyme membrane subunit Stt3